MIILTAANCNNPQDASGKIENNFSFKFIIQDTISNCERFGYHPVVYDLGDLGIGEKFDVEEKSFNQKGHYKEIKKGYKSKSLFKPDIVEKCLQNHMKFTVYIDGDALLYNSIDEVKGDDFDVGVTLRRPSEMEGDWYEKYKDIVKYVNAGVIFFNPTDATFQFLNTWRNKTKEVKNDQKALNQLVCKETYPQVNSIETIHGVRIKYFPCDQYNYYYFKEGLVPNIKILHFKGTVRQFYPFTWEKRFYCRFLAPFFLILSNNIKKHNKL